MKILILTTYYPPDTAIAAVRPYMLAKYLKQHGHDVTVLRSGLLQQSADRSFSGHEGIRIITYLGDNSPSVQFENGKADFMCQTSPSGKSRIDFVPESLRKLLAKVFHTLTAPYNFYCWYKKRYYQARFVPLKAAIDKLAQEKFDFVFSTYGDIENIWGGEYAAKVFGAKWVQDFRDPIEPHAPNRFGLPFLKKVQKKAVQNCDLCTAVSEDLAKHLSVQAGGKTVHTLYNGYEPLTDTLPPNQDNKDGMFSICYTGLLYVGTQTFTPLLQALYTLKKQGKICLSKVRIHYAGPNFDYLHTNAERFQLSEIVVNHGYVGRAEAAKIQQSSDLYTVLSWNTKSSQGILTGKFYEGIRAGKPILSIISGNVPYSELSQLQDKYQYGFCYENCREKEQFQQLCDYLEALYHEKMSTGKIAYNPDPALETDFRYDTLAKKLESLCLSILP